MPGVSTNKNSALFSLRRQSIVCRVVCGLLVSPARCLLINKLNKVDLPTFGFPIIAIVGLIFQFLFYNI